MLSAGLAGALYSPNRLYRLLLQNNGELQVLKGGLPLWRTNIYAPVDLKGCTAKLEDVGIVVRDPSNRVIWQMLSSSYVSALSLDVQ